jgi:hypothetical protein
VAWAVLMHTAMNRLLFAFASLPLVACYGGERRNTGECPAGETCSDTTPTGLEFVGNSLGGEILLSGPRPTAIGGTQVISLQYQRNGGFDVPLDLPFTADDDGGNGVKVDSTSGAQVTVRGAGSRSNYLRILDLDGMLMDRKMLTGAALDTIELLPTGLERSAAGRPIAFAPGNRRFAVALWGDVQTSSGPQSERLIDTSMAVLLPGADRKTWDTLEINASGPGTMPVSVTAGDKPAAQIDLVIADHADSVALGPNAPSTIYPNGSATVCFEAVAAGRYLAGLTWTFNVDGVAKVQGDDSLARNCISVSTQKTSGSVSIQASAGGQTTAMALTVGAMARESKGAIEAPAMRATSHAIPTAGDRASM